MTTVEERLAAQGFTIPPLPKSGGKYVPGIVAGDLLFLSGAIGTSFKDGKWSLPITGKLGGELSIEQGCESARYCVLNHLAAIKSIISNLDRVRQVVKLVGYVNAAPGFTKAPLVLDGASDLLIAAFGPEIGQHARTAAYQHEMSFNAPIETDLVVDIGDGRGGATK
jgi:enamine deaminase RidA (YjgF/YER057c/UK114 family)